MGFLASEVRFQLRHVMTSPVRVEKRTSATKAVKRSPFYGTAEAVPFVGQSLHEAPSVLFKSPAGKTI